MLLNSEKWHEGYNDGYWLGRDGSVIAEIIYGAYSSKRGDYGTGLRFGYEIGREQVKQKETDRLAELGNLRAKGQDMNREI